MQCLARCGRAALDDVLAFAVALPKRGVASAAAWQAAHSDASASSSYGAV